MTDAPVAPSAAKPAPAGAPSAPGARPMATAPGDARFVTKRPMTGFTKFIAAQEAHFQQSAAAGAMPAGHS
ncbi:MAG: hypothetical protein JSS43_17360 [Proteobacteria bacterium]|nr:hypothetical protein [Pseudomonadota bacterium]